MSALSRSASAEPFRVRSSAGQRRPARSARTVRSAKDVFDPLEEWLLDLRIGLAARRRFDVGRQHPAELLDRFALIARQLLRDRDLHRDVEIATAATGDARHALAAQTEAGAAWRGFRDRDALLVIERRHLHAAAEHERGEADSDLAVQIVVFTPEEIVLLDVDDDVEIASRATGES